MAAKEPVKAATRKRFDEELKRVQECMEREMIRAGVAEDASEIWPAHETWGGLLARIAASEETHRLTVVVFATHSVQESWRSLQGGARESAIEALENLASAIRCADSVMHDVAVNAYLTSIANVGAIGFQEEPPVDSRPLTTVRESLDWEALRKTAETAELIAGHLVLRRPDAVEADIYSAKGAGPFAHFCDELADGLSLEEIAEVTGEVRPRSAYDSESRWLDAQ